MNDNDWNPLKLDLRRDPAFWCDYNPSQCKSNGYYEKQPFVNTLHPTCDLPYELEGPVQKSREQKIKDLEDEKSYFHKTIIFSIIFIILFIILVYIRRN